MVVPEGKLLPPCPGANYYAIGPGDTLHSIARMFGISIDALAEANKGWIEPENLRVGQIICIPSAGAQPACAPGWTVYRIVQGDTFYTLAKRFGTTVEAMMQNNPGVNPDNLLPGQTICVPGQG